MKTYEPNLGVVELCVTYRCNVKCANCSNLCTQAPCNDQDLSTADVRCFLADSIHHGHKWGMITVHGGEPVLNPVIDEICELLVHYKNRFNPKCIIYLLTNNSCREVRHRTTTLHVKHGIPLGISTKRDTNQGWDGSPIAYVPVNASPADLGIDHENGCFQTSNCGVCYNKKGFFGCSPMAAAARVFGYEPTAKSIKDFTPERIKDHMALHCKHCGFSAPSLERETAQRSTPTWKEKLERYADARA